MDLILKSAQMAALLHLGQKRKYNGRPYITHPARVAARLCYHPKATVLMVGAAWLHDAIEECGISAIELERSLPPELITLVLELTNPSKQFPKLPRPERKAMDRSHLGQVSNAAKLIKLVDRADNLVELSCDLKLDPKVAPDKTFAETYRDESKALLRVLEGTDEELEREFEKALASLSASL